MNKPDWVTQIPTQNADLVSAWYMLEVLGRFRGNRTHACKAMGIGLRGFRNILARLEAQGFPIPVYDGKTAAQTRRENAEKRLCKACQESQERHPS